MSESFQRMYVESVGSAAANCVRLVRFTSTATGESRNDYGGGIISVSVLTTESTPAAAFWGATGTCSMFDVIFRKVS